MSSDQNEAAQTLRHIRRRILEAATRAKEGHIASSFSILEILYTQFLIVHPRQRAESRPQDVFILSKGHASIGLYAVLAEASVIPHEWLNGFAAFESPLGGHPDASKVPGVHLSTGSLGHALAVGVGLAMGNRVMLPPEQRPRLVVLIGDGEANEGSVWEAVALAAHHSLRELVCIVDHNHSTDRALGMDPINSKFESFGWDAATLDDGHDLKLLEDMLMREPGDRPLALIASTTKGKGVPEMENNPAWHHAYPTEDQLSTLLRALE